MRQLGLRSVLGCEGFSSALRFHCSRDIPHRDLAERLPWSAPLGCGREGRLGTGTGPAALNPGFLGGAPESGSLQVTMTATCEGKMWGPEAAVRERGCQLVRAFKGELSALVPQGAEHSRKEARGRGTLQLAACPGGAPQGKGAAGAALHLDSALGDAGASAFHLARGSRPEPEPAGPALRWPGARRWPC